MAATRQFAFEFLESSPCEIEIDECLLVAKARGRCPRAIFPGGEQVSLGKVKALLGRVDSTLFGYEVHKIAFHHWLISCCGCPSSWKRRCPSG